MDSRAEKKRSVLEEKGSSSKIWTKKQRLLLENETVNERYSLNRKSNCWFLKFLQETCSTYITWTSTQGL